MNLLLVLQGCDPAGSPKQFESNTHRRYSLTWDISKFNISKRDK